MQTRRQLGKKAQQMGANAVLGYTECVDLEGDVTDRYVQSVHSTHLISCVKLDRFAGLCVCAWGRGIMSCVLCRICIRNFGTAVRLGPPASHLTGGNLQAFLLPRRKLSAGRCTQSNADSDVMHVTSSIHPSLYPSDSTGSGNLDEDPRQAMPVPPVRRAAGQSSASDEGDHRPLQEADTINLTEEETDTDVNEEDRDKISDKQVVQLNGR